VATGTEVRYPVRRSRALWVDAAVASIELADLITSLQAAWRERAGRPRAGSAAAKIIPLLPALPVLSARPPAARSA